ncbi:hypothetical protein [Umezawaea beigongshangensis]|uniref:hypothetical protein n=1 Tax=Umezawaea beigongshangensis TaxID=2780383 RepID=UPI0018F23EBA|nr:hypothetical protein [Umezawaea beigongshangensis]
MEYVIAAVAQAVLQRWRVGVAGVEQVEFRCGRGTEVVGDSDAAIVGFQMAHDRYGGVPEIGRAQVLRNHRNDGYPRHIVTTPPFPAGPEIDDEAELRTRLQLLFETCFDAVQRHNENAGAQRMTSLFLHVEGVGLDRYGQVAASAFHHAVQRTSRIEQSSTRQQ